MIEMENLKNSIGLDSRECLSIFKLMDKEQKGIIHHTSLSKFFRNNGISISEQGFLRRIDADQDGTIPIDELVSALMPLGKSSLKSKSSGTDIDFNLDKRAH